MNFAFSSFIAGQEKLHHLCPTLTNGQMKRFMIFSLFCNFERYLNLYKYVDDKCHDFLCTLLSVLFQLFSSYVSVPMGNDIKFCLIIAPILV